MINNWDRVENALQGVFSHEIFSLVWVLLSQILSMNPGPEIIKNSWSTKLRTKIFLIINVKMPTIGM